MDNPGVPASMAARYLHSLCQLLVCDGAKPDDLLAGTGLRLDDLSAPGRFVSHDQLDQCLGNIEQHTREPLPGVRLGHHLNVSAHGSVGYAGLTAANGEQAIAVAIRFFPLMTSLASLSLHHQGERAELRITPSPEASERTEAFVVHALLASFDVMGRFLVGDLDLQADLALPESPGLQDRLSPSIHTLRFGQHQHRFSMPLARLRTPFTLADQSAHHQAVAQCERELATLRERQSLSGRVLARLGAGDGPLPDQETVAGELGMSSRTLHRRLLKEGTSYRALVQHAKLRQARTYLVRHGLSVTETAYRLGYQDSANFTRAFRQATGMTPTQFVRAHPRR